MTLGMCFRLRDVEVLGLRCGSLAAILTRAWDISLSSVLRSGHRKSASVRQGSCLGVLFTWELFCFWREILDAEILFARLVLMWCRCHMLRGIHASPVCIGMRV